MSRDGWLPPGVTDRDIDEASPGYWDDDPQPDELETSKSIAYFVWAIRTYADNLMALGAKPDLMEAIEKVIDEHKLGSF